MTEPYPTADEIRQGLLDRAAEYRQLTGVSWSDIGKSAVNDPAFLSQCSKGRNFTIELYNRVMTWLDDNWPPVAASSGGVVERAAS